MSLGSSYKMTNAKIIAELSLQNTKGRYRSLYRLDIKAIILYLTVYIFLKMPTERMLRVASNVKDDGCALNEIAQHVLLKC